MPNFHRYYIPNAVVFITCVTKDRKPILQPDGDYDLFWDILKNVQKIYPFHILAYVILPDHFHWLMRVEKERSDFSKVMHSIKWNYTLEYKKRHQITTPLQIWQKRFWDHVIRDETDLENHFDYVHWNPVKHKYVDAPDDWSRSTYSFWYEKGEIPDRWGNSGTPRNILGMEYE